MAPISRIASGLGFDEMLASASLIAEFLPYITSRVNAQPKLNYVKPGYACIYKRLAV